MGRKDIKIKSGSSSGIPKSIFTKTVTINMIKINLSKKYLKNTLCQMLDFCILPNRHQ